MFKKSILLILTIALLVLSALTACSSETVEGIIPPAVASDEQGPTTPAATPTPATTPPEKVSEKVSEAISVSEFAKRVENGEYKAGDAVMISGIVENAYLEEKETFSTQFEEPADTIFMGMPNVREFHPLVLVIFEKETIVLVRNEITVKGTIAFISTERIKINKAVVAQ